MSFVDTSLEEEFEDEELPEGEPEEIEGEELPPVTNRERAMAMGWKPLPADPRNPQPHEYRGDPRKWTDEDAFIAKGEEELPILRDQNRRMSERLVRNDTEFTTLRNTIEEQNAAIRHVTALAKRADTRGYDRAKAELIEKRRSFVEAGDVEGHDQVQEQLDALETSRAEIEEPPPVRPTQAPEITAFIADHEWFREDAGLRQAMIDEHNLIIGKFPAMPVGEQLEKALERMERLHPEILEDEDPVPRTPAPAPRRRAAPALAPSGPTGQRRAPASPLERITDPAERADARAAFESMRRADPGFSEAEYMKIYDDPKIDVVELRRQRK